MIYSAFRSNVLTNEADALASLCEAANPPPAPTPSDPKTRGVPPMQLPLLLQSTRLPPFWHQYSPLLAAWNSPPLAPHAVLRLLLDIFPICLYSAAAGLAAIAKTTALASHRTDLRLLMIYPCIDRGVIARRRMSVRRPRLVGELHHKRRLLVVDHVDCAGIACDARHRRDPRRKQWRSFARLGTKAIEARRWLWLMRSIGRDGGGLGNKSEPWCIYIDMEGFSALYAKEGQILCHSVKWCSPFTGSERTCIRPRRIVFSRTRRVTASSFRATLTKALL